MLTSAQDVLNYYLNNPPFEVDENNLDKYTQILDKALTQTLIELSENDPIIDEKIFKTPEKDETNKNITDDNYILVDIYETIDQRFMDFIVLTELSELPLYINRVLGRYIPYHYGSKNFSLLNLLSDDALYVLHQYTWKRIERFLIRDRYIKLKPNTEYYTLYKRYRDISEINRSQLNCFIKLFEVNLFLAFFQSSVYSGDNLFRSFSISGLSISLNPPSIDQAVRMLTQEKYKTLQSCMDYGDLVMRF
jgi:hypothetical protein